MTKGQLDFIEDNVDITTIRPFKYDAMSIEEL